MEIRSIKPEDVAGVVRLMRAFAEFENLLEYCEVTPEKLENVLFGQGSFVESLVAIDDNGELIAYSIFYPHFASFRGQTGYYLEDIFIADRYRGQGLGEELLRTIAGIAARRGFDRLDFQVLDWNTKAVNFYLRLGAVRDDSERHFKFTDEAFRSLSA